MIPLDYFTLDLRSPLVYARDAKMRPFEYSRDSGETVHSFTVFPEQAYTIEPSEEHYIGAPEWIGRSTGTEAAGPLAEIPGGLYFFSQTRMVLDRDDFIRMAIEVQKEALWQKKSLGTRLYLRYLYEGGGPVTQVFREIIR
ncbi:hypothetical protein [Breznakiella homolactica]|uniref:Uncharacterized protein n=1 Tax=Breznakiella homolactica TaxID=2798577 RepID=A0A7T8BBU5_9SPIR|nr:hypothetical protein [Breznakiella homolactica]QQO09558.1 hypothetical protein JFL75_01150 [Breznakiella homolactica]